MMGFSRRHLIGAGAAALMTARSQPSLAQDDEVDGEFEGMEALSPLPSGFSNGIAANPQSPNFGSSQPPQLYRNVANILLTGAPVRCRPIDVAYYFSNLRMGQLPPATQRRFERLLRDSNREDLISSDFVRLFAYDWEHSHYFNPVVVQFIVGIRQTPYAGDLTPWCAAFANWCISRSQATNPTFVTFSDALLARGTRSASSGSFRCFGESTQTPVEGDLVVWAKVGTEDQSCPINLGNAQGHVGFFVNSVTRANGSIGYRVLGGNQGFIATPLSVSDEVGQRDIAQAVSFRTIGRRWNDRRFHSFRTSAMLRGAA